MRCASTGFRAASRSCCLEAHNGVTPAGARARACRHIAKSRHAAGLARRGRGTPDAGFTLLETLIALVILSFALTALYNSTGTSARAIAASGAHMEARILAETMLAEMTSLRTPKLGTTSGTYKQFRWHTTVAAAEGDWVPAAKDAPWVPLHVVVTVEWPPRRRFVLQTVQVRARPKS